MKAILIIYKFSKNNDKNVATGLCFPAGLMKNVSVDDKN